MERSGAAKIDHNWRRGNSLMGAGTKVLECEAMFITSRVLMINNILGL